MFLFANFITRSGATLKLYVKVMLITEPFFNINQWTYNTADKIEQEPGMV